MGLARTHSAIMHGVVAHIVDIEAHIAAGLPSMSLIGLPDTALRESRDRVRAAIVNSGLKWPDSRITIGLSPAWLPKRGTGLDVAIALAVLAADSQIPADQIAGIVVLGELGLDGRIRGVSGALSAALALRDRPERSTLSGEMVTGPRDGRQIGAVPGIEPRVAPTLRALAARLRGEQESDADVLCQAVDDDLQAGVGVGAATLPGTQPSIDMRDVAGQSAGKLALEIAAAGGHHLAMLGRAGVGKTLLAERLPDLLPDLTVDESLEVTAIHQLAGRVSGVDADALISRPPWCSPHHTASRAALVGGGRDDKPTIGLVTLAHRGVLFLDEAAEFDPSALDALREPLESGEVSIARAGFRIRFPARLQLVLASNPCPCGNSLDPNPATQCRCTPSQRRRYLGRLSGPMLDRLDLRVVLTKPTLAELRGLTAQGETTGEVAARVLQARHAAMQRMAGTPWTLIAQVPGKEFLDRWPMPVESQRALDRFCGKESVRGRHRVTRIAWTVADLAGHSKPRPVDVETAMDLRATAQEWVA